MRLQSHFGLFFSGRSSTVNGKVNISPKSRFKQNESDTKAHASLVKDEAFHRALEYSLLSYVKKLVQGTAGDLTSSAVAYHRIAGAVEFQNELLTIHEMPTVADRKPLGQLNQHA